MDQLLFEQHPSSILVYDLDTLNILKVNTAFLEKYKYPETDIAAGKITIRDIHPQQGIPALMEALDNLGSGINHSGVHRHQSANGEVFYVKITSQGISHEGHDARLVVCIDITEQVEAERKVSRAYKQLQHHITNSPLASVEWDRDLRVVEWSQRACEISGFDEDEMLGTSLMNFGKEDSEENERVKERLKALLEGKRDRDQFETTILHKNGYKVYIRVHSSVLRTAEKEMQSVLTLVEDITEQKKSEIKYQRLFENANDSILLIKDGVFVDCNKKAEALYKASRDEIIGSSPANFSPDKQPDGSCSVTEANKRLQKALKDGSNIFEWQHKNTEGELISVEVSLNKITFPDGLFVQAIVRDITDKKNTEARLRRSEELFRNLFLKSPAALVMVDADDQIQVVNESFEKMFGYHSSEIKGKNIDDLVVPKTELEEAATIKNRSDASEDFQVEGMRVAKSGLEKHVIIAGMPVHIDGEPVAGLGMYIDISDRKKKEQELKASLKDKQVLIEEVHHRVKNNLAVVSGLLQMQTMHVDDERLTKYIQNSQLRIQSMAIVHEMLYQSSTLSDIQFKDYVEKLADVIAETLAPRAKNITVEVKAEDITLNVNQAIPCALIISELITNAYEYAFEGREEGFLQIITTKNNDLIDVEVKDDGIGLPANFEEKKGKSLGMNLMETLCQQLDTIIKIETGEWGTAFSFEFERSSASGSSSTNRV